MKPDASPSTQDAVDRVVELAKEVETHAAATVGGARLDRLRSALHAWVDTVEAVVVNAAVGRVTLIHKGGRESTVSSAQLPFILSGTHSE